MNKQHYALVIGIDRYPGISDLHSARKDAESFFNWLIDPKLGAVPRKNIRLITTDDAETPPGTPRRKAKPVRDQVEDALFELWDMCRTHITDEPADWFNSRLYVFGSGHGIAPNPQEAALLMANAGPDHYGKNFSYAKYLSWFQKAQFFHELVFFADFCRERIANAPLLGPTWTEINNHNGNLLTVRGLATYFGDLAFEEEPDDDDTVNPDELRGYFTKALLEGLNGQAIDPDTREINSQSLATYVTERVRILTKHRPKPQVPFFVAEPVTPTVTFRKNVPPHEAVAQRHTVTIIFPPDFAAEVVLLDGNLKKIDTHSAADGNWVVSLGNGLYRVAPTDGENTFANAGFFEIIGAERNVEL